MNGNSFFYVVALVAAFVMLVTGICCLSFSLRDCAKQGLFVGSIGGLLSLSILSVVFIYQLMLFPGWFLAFLVSAFCCFLAALSAVTCIAVYCDDWNDGQFVHNLS
jgi:hypothetical protein